MANKVTHGDLAVLAVAGGSQIDFVRNCRLEMPMDTDDGSTLLSGGERIEVTKKAATLSATLLSSVSNSRVGNLDLTSVSIASVDYLAYARSARLSYRVANAESSGVAAKWKEPQPIPQRRALTFSCSLMVPRATATANALRLLASAKMKSADREDHICALSFVINSVTFAAPCTLVRCDLIEEIGELLMVEVELAARAPISGTYISSPSGTTSLIEKAINQSDTAIAFDFTPHDDAGYGSVFSGNMVIDSWDFAVEDGRMVETNFVWQVTGAVGGADT